MLAEAAHRYRTAGLSVLPARREGEQKRVALRTWKPYQSRLPTESEVGAWFANGHTALCLVCGEVSGHLEVIDFDLAGEALSAWRDLVHEAAPELLDRLVVESTPSGGYHVVYRCESPVSGNLKLAQRQMILPDGEPITVAGKAFVPRKQPDGSWSVLLTLIETRGEGGIFLCAPSDGYELIQGDLADLPVLTAEERETLLSAAWALNEVVPTPEPIPSARTNAMRPGDVYATQGDVRDVLRRHGWSLARTATPSGNGNEYWRRPGKSEGWSATLKEMPDGVVFYVFSSNAAPFDQGRAYGPFAVYAMLEHHGDFTAAARALRSEGYGDDGKEPDVSGIVAHVVEPAEPQQPDPGPMPEGLLRVPGFVNEVMDHCLATAPYPNLTLAFGGALSLQAFLAGRKVRDPGDNRTNMYILSLAHSSAGKDSPRKINTKLIHMIGLGRCLGSDVASGEGLQDALFVEPAMLVQTDEIDSVLQSMNKIRDARYESMMRSLLTFYSSSNSVYPMRRKAGMDYPGVIDQPCLVLFGTAIPNHYYQALSERMLTNGFFARMLVLEATQDRIGQEPTIRDLPPRIVTAAQWWADFRPGEGNLEDCHVTPVIIEQTEEARRLLVETREEADAEYNKAQARQDAVGTTVWGRVSEQTRKLALIYAVSESREKPRIGLEATRWASQLVTHQVRRMLYQVADHVAENPFHADCLKLIRKLREAPGGQMGQRELMRAMHQKLPDFEQLVGTLLMQGEIVEVDIPTKTKPAKGYRLP